LSNLNVLGALRGAKDVFKMLQLVPRIRNFHLEAYWGTVTCSDSRRITVVVDEPIEDQREIKALHRVLDFNRDLLSVHLILKADDAYDEIFEMRQIFQVRKKVDIVVDFHMSTDDGEVLAWLEDRQLVLKMHKHHWINEHGTRMVSQGSLEYVPHLNGEGPDYHAGSVHLDSKQPWAKQFARYLVEEEHDKIWVVWVDTVNW
jgi:hypothetical protein